MSHTTSSTEFSDASTITETARGLNNNFKSEGLRTALSVYPHPPSARRDPVRRMYTRQSAGRDSSAPILPIRPTIVIVFLLILIYFLHLHDEEEVLDRRKNVIKIVSSNDKRLNIPLSSVAGKNSHHHHQSQQQEQEQLPLGNEIEQQEEEETPPNQSTPSKPNVLITYIKTKIIPRLSENKNVIILTYASYSYREMLLNWLVSLRRVEKQHKDGSNVELVSRVVLVCLDDDLTAFVERLEGFGCIPLKQIGEEGEDSSGNLYIYICIYKD